jgi:hypothetical protein
MPNTIPSGEEVDTARQLDSSTKKTGAVCVEICGNFRDLPGTMPKGE